MTKTQKKIVIATASVSLIVAALLVLYYYFVTNVKKEELEVYTPKYFTIDELTSSYTADRNGIDNTPKNQDIIDNLLALCMKVLDPIREAYGKPIKVNSGYRCPELEVIVSGKAYGQHMKGEAADITTGSLDGNRILFDLIKQSGQFDQLIDEKNLSWIHVSYKRVGYNRKQTLKL